MPELPDITVYIEALRERVVGRRLSRIHLFSPFVLRTAEPPVETLEGARVEEIERLGKRIAFGFDNGAWLVMHLMIAGRLHWEGSASPGVPPPGRPTKRKRNAAAALEFENGTLLLTEAGTKKRASLHVAADRAALAAHERGGLDVRECSLAAFIATMTRENHTLKRALTDPSILSGIGNAYSDEILHRAGLSPVALTSRMSPDEWARLHAAARETLDEWTRRLREESRGRFPKRSRHSGPRCAYTDVMVNRALCAAPRYSVSASPRTRRITVRAARPAAGSSRIAPCRGSSRKTGRARSTSSSSEDCDEGMTMQPGGPGGWPRMIVHADMDAFYASIEQLDDPTLRGRPLLVGPRSSRGVVLTASYEARPFGVGSAMPMVEARRRCPQALVVPPRFERYREVSKRVMAVFADFSPQVEPLSLDEAFLDMSGSERILGSPERIGMRLKEAVREVTGGLTVSVGVSGTKYVAKVASGYRKPDGLTIVPPDEMRAWLAPLPVARLWGAGAKTQAKLRALGLETIGDVASRSAEELYASLGNTGVHFHELALGRDPRLVDGSRPPKSMGSECTLEADIDSAREVAFYLRGCAEKVGRRLRSGGYVARGVRVKLKRSDFRLLSRQCTLSHATDLADDLYHAALGLLPAFGALKPMRLVGLAAFDLMRMDAEPQADLLAFGTARKRALEVALDRIEERFGPGIVQRASLSRGDHSLGLGSGSGSDLDDLRGLGGNEED